MSDTNKVYTDNRKVKPNAFVVCRHMMTNTKNGEFHFYKGSLNVDGTWQTVMCRITKNGDFLIEFYAKGGNK